MRLDFVVVDHFAIGVKGRSETLRGDRRGQVQRQCEEYDECQDDCKNSLHLIGIGQVLPNFVKPFLDATAVTCRTHDRYCPLSLFKTKTLSPAPFT
jgi:hypothetical protein